MFTLMSNCTEDLSELDKYCMLSFDEMHIDSKVFYDCGIDQIFVLHSKVQFCYEVSLVSGSNLCISISIQP